MERNRRAVLLTLAGAAIAATAMLLSGPVARFAYEDECLDLGGGTQTGRCDYGTLKAPPPSGWRYLPGREAQVALGLPESRKAELQRLYQEADLDGDGRPDEAAVLVNEADRSYSLFAFRNGARPEQLTPARRPTDFGDVMLHAASGGQNAGQADTLTLITPDGREAFTWNSDAEAWRPLRAGR